MSEIKVTAGKFTASVFTDGYPYWVTISSSDHNKQEIHSIHHTEIADLEYVVSRLRERLKSESSKPNEI